MAKVKALKTRSIYRCDGCGHVESKWMGRCPACQTWNSLIEEVDAGGHVRPSATGVADGDRELAVGLVQDRHRWARVRRAGEEQVQHV